VAHVWSYEAPHMSTKSTTLDNGTARMGRVMAAFRHAYVAFEYKSCTQHT
jgi:hypothetical protein